MTGSKRSPGLIDETLTAPLTRRGLLRTAIGAGVTVPGLGALLAAAPRVGAQESGQPGGTVTIIVPANPASWDLSTSTWPTWQTCQFMYDRLLTFDDEEQLQPALATAWEVSEDGLEYLLTLRSGVTFHDGTPFNAEAVRFNVQRHLDVPDSAFYASYEAVAQVEVVDELTAKIVLNEIRPNFVYEGLALWGAIQVSPTAYAELGDHYGEAPVGTGPFKFESYEPGSSVTFVRNDEYWNGAPLLDEVVVRVIPEPSVQLIEMEAGTADQVQLVQPKDIATLEDAGVVIENRISPGTVFISLNSSQPPTNELAVRKAIAHAIDRDTIIETVLLGYAEKSLAGVTSGSVFYNADIPGVEHDPELAGTLLDEAGWALGDDGIRQKDGTPLKVNILSTDFAGWGLYNQIYQEQLLAIGIDSEISTLEWNAYLDTWRENQGGWNVTHHSQGTIVAAVAAIQAGWIPDAFWTITQIDDAADPDLVTLREQLQGISDEFETTLDLARRQELAKQAQMLVAENQLTVWLWHLATIQAVQPRVKGHRFSHAGRVIELDKAWVEE